MNNDNFEPMNALGVFGLYLGLSNYALNLKQTTNDDILKELKDQAVTYLQHSINQNELIIKQNEEIISLLKGDK